MIAILTFFVLHWSLSVFAQTFFLHRYSAHRMFTMSKGWEKFFYLFTLLAQGSSFLIPRAYAILHREHHAYSDTEKDPHSPWVFPGFLSMMVATKARYYGMVGRTIKTEDRFMGGTPEWDFVDSLGDSWFFRLSIGALYTLFYIAFAPHWAFFFLLPIHYLMGPIHGAIVNWCGHKYGYRNFNSTDKSRNTLPFDFITFGELFQNNHHEFGMAPNFAARAWELDPTWPVIWTLDKVGIIQLSPHIQKARWTKAAKIPKAKKSSPVIEVDVAPAPAE